MGSLYRRGRVWWGQYRDETGKRKQVSLDTRSKQEAQDYLAELEKAARECRLGIADGKSNHVLIAPLLAAYMRERSQELRPDTLKSYRLHFANVLPDILGLDFEPVGRRDSKESLGELLKALGNHAVSEVTLEAVSDWRTARVAEGRALRTATMEAGAVKTFLQWCKANGKTRTNPLQHMKPRRAKEDRRFRSLTETEVKALVTVSPPHLALTWRMFVMTGLRASELLNLNWGDVDLSRRLAFIRKTKTGEPRTVRFHEMLCMDLASWKQERWQEGEPVGNNDPVFTNAKGKRWRDLQSIRKNLRTCARRAALDADELTTHGLRHTYGTLATHKQDVTLGEAKATLGHKSLQMLAHYMHDEMGSGDTKTMVELDRLLHELTPEVAEEQVRDLKEAVGDGVGPLVGTDGTDTAPTELQSDYTRGKRHA